MHPQGMLDRLEGQVKEVISNVSFPLSLNFRLLSVIADGTYALQFLKAINSQGQEYLPNLFQYPYAQPDWHQISGRFYELSIEFKKTVDEFKPYPIHLVYPHPENIEGWRNWEAELRYVRPEKNTNPDKDIYTSNENTVSGFTALYAASHNDGLDFQSDWFHYSLPTGENGRFFLECKQDTGSFSERYNCWLYPNTEAAVNAVQNATDAFQTFTITDRYGLECQFGDTYIEYPETYYSTYGYSAWMLKKVTDPKTGRNVDYTYSPYSDTEAEELENRFVASCASIYDEDPRSSTGRGIFLTNGQMHTATGTCNHKVQTDGFVYLEENCLGAKQKDYTVGTVNGYRCWKVNTISDGYTTVTFNYTTSIDNRIGSIVVTSGGMTVKRIIFNTDDEDGVPVLTSITMEGKTGSPAQTYGFDYNMAWNSNAPDFWGFATGRAEPANGGYYSQQRTVSYTEMNGEMTGGYDLSVNGNPGSTATTTLGTHDFSGTSSATGYLLKKIVYPTGGYSNLTYECGQYLYGGTARTGGSPRVKAISDYPTAGSTRTRSFTYHTGKVEAYPEQAGLYLTAFQQVSGTESGHVVSMNRTFANIPHFGLDIDVYYPQVDVTYNDGTSSFKEVYSYNTTSGHTYGSMSILGQYTRYYVKNFFSNPIKGKITRKQTYNESTKLMQEEG